MNIKKTIGALMMCAISAIPMMAQQTCAESYQPCTYQVERLITLSGVPINSSAPLEKNNPTNAITTPLIIANVIAVCTVSDISFSRPAA